MASTRYPKLNDRGWLRREYEVRGRTAKDIAAEIGCDGHTVRRALRSNDIEIRKRPGRVPSVKPGQRYGRLVVGGEIGRTKTGKRIHTCGCDCGAHVEVESHHLQSGGVKSCGCLKRERGRTLNLVHGLSGHPMFGRWWGMIQRCSDPNHERYKRYGGRGIDVCAEWRSDFSVFLAYVQRLPHYGEVGRELHRMDNDGNYEPGNIEWMLKEEHTRLHRAGWRKGEQH